MILKLMYIHSADGRCIKKELAKKDFGYRITHGSLSEFEKEGDERKDSVGTKACQLVHCWAIEELTKVITYDEYMDIWEDIKKIINNQHDIQVEWRDVKRYQENAESKFTVYSNHIGNPIGVGSRSTEIYATEILNN